MGNVILIVTVEIAMETTLVANAESEKNKIQDLIDIYLMIVQTNK